MIPYQIRIQPELLEEVQDSATKHNEGVVNKEIRELIRIGLKNRKRGEKKCKGYNGTSCCIDCFRRDDSINNHLTSFPKEYDGTNYCNYHLYQEQVPKVLREL